MPFVGRTLDTWFMLGVVLAIPVCLISCVVLDSREAARRNGCINNARQLSLSCTMYEGANGIWPMARYVPGRLDQVAPAAVGEDASTSAGHSFLTMLSPYMEENILYGQIRQNSQDFSLSPFAPTVMGGNTPPGFPVVDGLLCPTFTGAHQVDPTGTECVSLYTSLGLTNYMALAGTHIDEDGRVVENGVIVSRCAQNDECTFQGLSTDQIGDGTSKTVVLCESRESRYSAWADSQATWVVGIDASAGLSGAGTSDLKATSSYLNQGEGAAYLLPGQGWPGKVARLWSPSSQHSGDVVVHVFADVHTQAISADIDPTVYYKMINRKDGEVRSVTPEQPGPLEGIVLTEPISDTAPPKQVEILQLKDPTIDDPFVIIPATQQPPMSAETLQRMRESKKLAELATQHEQAERYDDALTALDEALELSPKDRKILIQRGHLHARQKNWSKAADDFQHSSSFPRVGFSWFKGAALLHISGREEDYRKYCQQLLQHPLADNTGDKPQVARAFALAPQPALDPRQHIDLTRSVVERRVDKAWHLWHWGERASVEYRVGNYEQAIEFGSVVYAEGGHKAVEAISAGVLALAYHKQGNQKEAQIHLDRAAPLVDAYFKSPVLPTKWSHDWLHAKILVEEARQELAKPASLPPAASEADTILATKNKVARLKRMMSWRPQSKNLQAQLDALAQTDSAPLNEKGVTVFDVDARKDWQDTKLSVAKGETVVFSTQGRYSFRKGHTIGANGFRDNPNAKPGSGKWPVNELPGLALIGRIGVHGKPFFVGTNAEIETSENGNLFFTVNDDIRRINEGSLQVEFQVRTQTDQEQ